MSSVRPAMTKAVLQLHRTSLPLVEGAHGEGSTMIITVSQTTESRLIPRNPRSQAAAS